MTIRHVYVRPAHIFHAIFRTVATRAGRAAAASCDFRLRAASWTAPVLWRFRNTVASAASSTSSEFRIYAGQNAARVSTYPKICKNKIAPCVCRCGVL